MQVPLEISFRDVEKTGELEALIRELAGKMERFAEHIVSCRIAVERPQLHFRNGSPYRVRLDIRVPPGHEIVIRREPGEGESHQELPRLLRDVFDAARRRVRDLVEQQRGQIKAHTEEVENLAHVVRVFPEQGYGFVRSMDGREVYFHKNAVVNDGFDKLDVGTAVRCVVEMGVEGPQASTVQILEPPLVRSRDVPESGVEPPMGWA